MTSRTREIILKKILPKINYKARKELKEALRNNDSRIIQGQTVFPEIGSGLALKACALGFCAMVSGEKTINQVYNYFEHFGNIAHEFAEWFDSLPRAKVFQELADLIEEYDEDNRLRSQEKNGKGHSCKNA